MTVQRLEVRLDAERRRKLQEISAVRGAPISDVVRQMIDETHEEVRRAERLEAVLRISELHLEEMPEPDELSRQLDATYDVPALH